jgi:WD40 associated region in TFIID subunit, NTD2 domain
VSSRSNRQALAQEFFDKFSESLDPSHKNDIRRLATLRLPSHIQSDETAQRLRSDKFPIQMSRSGFALLLGWLTEGVGGEAPGAGDGFFGEKGRRGRAAVMRVVNNHLRFDGKHSSRALSHVLIPTRCSGHDQFFQVLYTLGGQHKSSLFTRTPIQWGVDPVCKSSGIQQHCRGTEARTSSYLRRASCRS